MFTSVEISNVKTSTSDAVPTFAPRLHWVQCHFAPDYLCEGGVDGTTADKEGPNHPTGRPVSRVPSIRQVTLAWLVVSWREQWLEWCEHRTEATVTCDPAAGGSEYSGLLLGTCCAKVCTVDHRRSATETDGLQGRTWWTDWLETVHWGEDTHTRIVAATQMHSESSVLIVYLYPVST